MLPCYFMGASCGASPGIYFLFLLLTVDVGRVEKSKMDFGIGKWTPAMEWRGPTGEVGG